MGVILNRMPDGLGDAAVILLYLLYIVFHHYLWIIYTFLTEDKSAFLDFNFQHNHTNFQPRPHYHTLFQHHVTVEVAVVCSKEFANNFNQDREMISDYVTAYFWDMSSRFRTLHQNKISFSVTSLTIIKSKEEQPFIENSRRDSKNGHTSLVAILPLFQKWISSNSRYYLLFPGFDVAMLFMEPNLEGGKLDAGAVAEFQGACHFREFKSAIVVRAGKMTAAMLELAKLLGAIHKKQCGEHSKVKESPVRGLKKDLAQFLSYCADTRITDFIEFPKSWCLHIAQGSPIIDPDFDSVLPPLILDQCRLLSGSSNATAVSTEAGNDCAVIRCNLPTKRGWGWFRSATNSVLITPLANSRCGRGRGEGRCFQGRCLPSGSLLTNVGLGLCLRRNNATSQFDKFDSFLLGRCPRSAAPSETFHVVEVNKGPGIMLKVPCGALSVFTEGMYPDESYLPQTNTFRCLDLCLNGIYIGQSDEFKLETCDEGNPYHRWEFRDMNNNGEFILYHLAKKMCPYSDVNKFGNVYISATKECDKNNPAMLWKLFPVLPEKVRPDADKAQLQAQLSFKVNLTNANVNVSLHNPDGALAFAPGVIVSWNRKSNATLRQVPENCFPFSLSNNGDVHSLKCKVGRLLQKKNETTLVATFNFNTTGFSIMQNLQQNYFQEAMGFSVTPTMASLFKADTHY